MVSDVPTRAEVEVLLEREMQFGVLELPGQPQIIHLGTSYLVSDMRRTIVALLDEVERLRGELKIAFDIHARLREKVEDFDERCWNDLNEGYELMRERETQLREVLEELLSAEPDMPSYDSTVEKAEEVLGVGEEGSE